MQMKQQFGLIGYPIKHSLSPWIHDEFMRRCGIEGEYRLFEIDPIESFSEQIKQLKQRALRGFNVTVPYKQTIIPYLDELDNTAEKIGAVNTVLNRNGRWIGFNTDGIGYVRSLHAQFPQLFEDKSKKVLLLGAGGAARGIYYALMDNGFHAIDMANRTMQHAMSITKLKNKQMHTAILSLEEAEQMTHHYDVIIQSTSVGMKPKSDQSIITPPRLKKGCIVSDIVYQPIMTSFLKQAHSLGANIHHGHTMLLYQAQYAFECWTDKNVSIDKMDMIIQRMLEGR